MHSLLAYWRKLLGFRVVKPDGETGLEEHSGLNRRPFYESTYVSRSAVPYGRHVEQNPEPDYNEDDLIRSLRRGRGFVLIGPPADGKTRTLYEIVSHMDDYEIIGLKADSKIPEKADLSLLFKESRVVLLLDDLSNPKNHEVDLLEFGQRLSECEIPWVVASTCQDGPELTRVQTELGRLYDSISLKLWLVAPTPQQKRQLAESIWNQPWDPERSNDYPTLGSIAMAEAVATMERRFDILSRNHPERAATLRALKLLDYAGVLPSHERLQAVLRSEELFQRRDLNLHESLPALLDQGFLRPGSTDPVQPEPGYLRNDGVVTYIPGRKPEDDFDKLADILEELEDAKGLHQLSLTCSERLEAYERAISYLDRWLRLRPYESTPRYSKGRVLLKLGLYEEALEAFEEALKIRPNDADALSGKGIVLYELGCHEEALEAFDEALKINPNHASALYNKGLVLQNLGRYEGAIDAYDAALKITPNNVDALNNKGTILRRMGCHEEALEAFDEALNISPNVYHTLNNKGIVLFNLARYEEALEAFDEALKIRLV